jgi:hypothetical protein
VAIKSKFPDHLNLPGGKLCITNLERKGALYADFNTFQRANSDIEYGDKDVILIKSPLHIAAYFGNVEYVQWKIDNQPDVLKNLGTRMILLHCLCARLFEEDTMQNYETYQYCFEKITSHELLEPPHTLWPRFILSSVFHFRNSAQSSNQSKLIEWLIALFLQRTKDEMLHTL